MRKLSLDRIETIAEFGYDTRGAKKALISRTLQKNAHPRHMPCHFPGTYKPALTPIIIAYRNIPFPGLYT